MTKVARIRTPKKFYLLIDDKLVLSGGDEDAIHQAVKTKLEEPAGATDPAEAIFRLISGVEVPLEIDTGVRVKIGARKRPKKDNGEKPARKKKDKAPAAAASASKPATTPTA